jgi:putative SOS response-associated peptidase YedK
MCGRFAFYSPSEATAALFGVNDSLEVEPRYNIAPTQYIAAIRHGENETRELTMLRWGLIPSWAKDPAIGNRMINARAETVAEKPSYRVAYRRRRCLVLADGFYEWHTEAAGTVPYYFSRASGQPFAFAGLWESWQSKTSDDSIQSATLITTAANEFTQPLHNRMPVVLDPEAADRWLAGDDELIDEVAKSGPRMRAWPVDRRVNNARNEGAELIEPVGDVRES